LINWILHSQIWKLQISVHLLRRKVDEWQLSPTPLTPDTVTGPTPATPPLPPPILPCHHHPPTCPPDTTQNLTNSLSTQMLPVFIS
jgi:hypothetical protein